MIPRTCSGHLYDVLEVTPDSSTEDIKRQYRRLALQLHPDRTHGATTELFQEVEEAHRILADPEQRRLYDTLGREGMKRLGDYGVPDFLMTARAIQPILFTVAFLFSMLLLALILIAVKLDSPKPLWSWPAVLAPLWILSPLFVLLGVICLLAGIKACSLEVILVGVELLMLVVIPAVACAALQGKLRNPSHAFVPCVILYGCGALRALYGLVPSVYAARRREQADILRGGDGSGSTVDLDSNASSNASNPAHSPCRSRTYWGALVQQLLEIVCVTAFASLCFARAEQGPVIVDDGDDPKDFLSFWVVFAPLIGYYGILVIWGFLGSLCRSSGGSSRFHDVDDQIVVENLDGSSPAHTAPNEPRASGASRANHRSPRGVGVDGSPTDAATASPSGRGCCSRVAEAVLAPFFYVCCLYMVCMWAAKAEAEWNRRAVPLHPSVYAATFPLFVALLIPVLLMCCLSCAVSTILSRTAAAAGEGEAGGDHEDRPRDHPVRGAAGATREAETTAPTYNSTGSVGEQRSDSLQARNHLGLNKRKAASDVD